MKEKRKDLLTLQQEKYYIFNCGYTLELPPIALRYTKEQDN